MQEAQDGPWKFLPCGVSHRAEARARVSGTGAVFVVPDRRLSARSGKGYEKLPGGGQHAASASAHAGSVRGARGWGTAVSLWWGVQGFPPVSFELLPENRELLFEILEFLADRKSQAE